MKTSVIRLFERALRDARTELEHMPDLLILTREISRKEMLGEVLEKTWIKMSSGRNEGGLFPLAAERTVRLLKDRGLPEDQVAYHDNTFWLQLDHMKYSIRRDGFRYYIRYLGKTGYINIPGQVMTVQRILNSVAQNQRAPV